MSRRRIITSAVGATASSAVAALTALCCFAPVAFASLGAASALASAWTGIAVELEAYRPYLLAVSAGFLGYGYWVVYFRKAPVAEGQACPLRAGRLARTALWVATLATLAAAATPYFLFRYVVL